MGYDFYLRSSENKCNLCSRSDEIDHAEMYVSYNHSWAFYDHLDKKEGLRWIYGKDLKLVIQSLERVVKDLVFLNGGIPVEPTGSIVMTIDTTIKPNDGWAMTMYNAYRCVISILKISEEYFEKYPNAKWYGD